MPDGYSDRGWVEYLQKWLWMLPDKTKPAQPFEVAPAEQM
jgi:hypothetical protein